MAKLTLTRRDAELVQKRAKHAIASWRAADFRWAEQEWQFIAVEYAALPKVARYLAALNPRSQYQAIERIEANGLPGYVMRPWNTPPSDHWPTSHHPGVVADGLRREVCGGMLPYYLANVELYQDQLKAEYGITVKLA